MCAFLLGLFVCLLPGCSLGASHSIFSISSPVQFPIAVPTPKMPFSCPLCSSQDLVKATQNPSISYLSDYIMDLMDHICMSYHWIVLCTLILGYKFFQRQINFFYALCSSNFTFGVTWLLGSKYSLSAGYFGRIFFWKGFTSCSWQIFCVHFSISSPFLIKASHQGCPRVGDFFCLSTGRKEYLLCQFPFLVICFPLKLWKTFLPVLMQWNPVWSAVNVTFYLKSLSNFKGL